MALTPADVHNVAFSRPRIGKRGYSEEEVDLFIDLVERELVRHLEEENELRIRCAELRNRDGGLRKREAELAEHGSSLPQQVALLRYREAQVGEREAQLAQREAELAGREDDLSRWESGIRQREAELAQREGELRQQQAERRERLDQQQAVVSCVGADAGTGQVPRPYRPAQQLRAVRNAVAVKGAPYLEEVRAVASTHGRHNIDRMAIRAVSETLGNTLTETDRRTRGGPIDHGSPGVSAEQSAQLEQLQKENAELAHSLGLLKSAAALLAAALDCP